MEWSVVWDYRDALWEGLRFTAVLSALAIAGSFLFGTLIGCVGALPGFLAPRLAGAYVEAMRNIPVVVKLFFLYYAAGLDAMPAALIGLVAHQSAYIADVVASGFRSIPREQLEAGWACGHSRPQIFRHILLPQVFRVVLPPTTTQFIEILKNSSVAMLIGIEELTFQTQRIESETFRGFEAATAVTLLYLALALAIVAAMTLVERRLKARAP